MSVESDFIHLMKKHLSEKNIDPNNVWLETWGKEVKPNVNIINENWKYVAVTVDMIDKL